MISTDKRFLMISVENLSKLFETHSKRDPVEALRVVNFRVKRGEFISIIGPSGCGKTTLLNLIAGFIRPEQGSVRFNGVPVSGPGPDRIMVFQEGNLFEWKTVRSNIEFGLKAKNLNIKKQKKISAEMVRLVGLNGFEDSYPSQLSTGMKKRVALARALAVDPDCVLMDEPLAGLDQMIKERLQLEIMHLWKLTRKTILFVTHDIEEAVFMAQRVFVMSPVPGKIRGKVEVDIAYPRKIEVKAGRYLEERKREVWELLRPGGPDYA